MKIDRIKKSFAAHGIYCYEDMSEHEFLPVLQPLVYCEVYDERRNVRIIFKFPKDIYTYMHIYRFMKSKGYLHRSRFRLKIK